MACVSGYFYFLGPRNAARGANRSTVGRSFSDFILFNSKKAQPSI